MRNALRLLSVSLPTPLPSPPSAFPFFLVATECMLPTNFSEGMDALEVLMFDQFGNYVLQTMLELAADVLAGRRKGKREWLSRLVYRIICRQSELIPYSSGKTLLAKACAVNVFFSELQYYVSMNSRSKNSVLEVVTCCSRCTKEGAGDCSSTPTLQHPANSVNKRSADQRWFFLLDRRRKTFKKVNRSLGNSLLPVVDRELPSRFIENLTLGMR